jgi:hypothetical protein
MYHFEIEREKVKIIPEAFIYVKVQSFFYFSTLASEGCQDG